MPNVQRYDNTMNFICIKSIELLFKEPKFGVRNELVEKDNHPENNTANFESVREQYHVILNIFWPTYKMEEKLEMKPMELEPEYCTLLTLLVYQE